MPRYGIFGAALGLTLGFAVLSASDISSAYPGMSNPGLSASTSRPMLEVTAEQREHIQRLKSAYRAAVSNLDWTVVETGGKSGHAPDSVKRVRELRMALHKGIMNVLTREGKMIDSESSCPYSRISSLQSKLNGGPTLRL